MDNLYSRRSSIMEWCVAGGLLAAVAAPSISLPGYGLTVTAFLAPLLLIFCLGKLRRGHLQIWDGIWLVFAMGAVVIVSTLWSYIGLAVPYNGGDFAEAYKFLQFIPYLIAMQFVDRARFEAATRRCIAVAALIVVIVGYIQLLNPSLGSIISKPFGGSDLQVENMAGAGRILLTGTDPNVGAAIGAFFVIYFAMRFVDSKKIRYFGVALALLVLVLETQSRTAILGILVAFVVYAFLFSKSHLIIKVFTLGCVVGGGFYLGQHLDLKYVSVGIQQAQNGDNTSVNARLDNLTQAWIWFQASPVFGWGPAKAIHDTIVDSEYALLLERYGCLGAMVFVLYIIRYIVKCRRVITLRVDRFGFHRSALIYIFFGIVLMVTNNLFSGYKLMALIILLQCNLRVSEISGYHSPRLTIGTVVK